MVKTRFEASDGKCFEQQADAEEYETGLDLFKKSIPINGGWYLEVNSLSDFFSLESYLQIQTDLNYKYPNNYPIIVFVGDNKRLYTYRNKETLMDLLRDAKIQYQKFEQLILEYTNKVG